MTLSTCTIDTPVGPLALVATPIALVAVLWEYDRAGRVRFDTVPTPVDASEHPVLATAVEQLEDYFAGGRTTFDLPLERHGTAFQFDAWDVLATIPFGSTLTYREQAERLGDARKARAVGAANGRNPLSIVVPCHRVVGAGNRLTGFAGGLDAKAWLLDHERDVLAGRVSAGRGRGRTARAVLAPRPAAAPSSPDASP